MPPGGDFMNLRCGWKLLGQFFPHVLDKRSIKTDINSSYCYCHIYLTLRPIKAI
jgi:hypothetical protein